MDLIWYLQLRSNLLAPSTDIDLIESRLDAVQELIELEDSFFNLRKSLKMSVYFSSME
jgi:DNA mismatch repair ATPase MutS